MMALRDYCKPSEVAVDYAIKIIAQSICSCFGGRFTSFFSPTDVDLENSRLGTKIGDKYRFVMCLVNVFAKFKDKGKRDIVVMNLLTNAINSAGKIKSSKKCIFITILSHLYALTKFYSNCDQELGPDNISIKPIRDISNLIEMVMCREYGGNEAMAISTEAVKLSRRIYGE
jgi:hypothetical protein